MKMKKKLTYFEMSMNMTFSDDWRRMNTWKAMNVNAPRIADYAVDSLNARFLFDPKLLLLLVA